MFTLLLTLTLSSFAQDVDPAYVAVGDLDFELPGLEAGDDLVIGFEASDDGSIEVRAGRVDPYKNFKFTISFGGGDAAWDVYDLCLDGSCPDAWVKVDGMLWQYSPETSSSSSSASDPEWRYVPVRRTSL